MTSRRLFLQQVIGGGAAAKAATVAQLTTPAPITRDASQMCADGQCWPLVPMALARVDAVCPRCARMIYNPYVPDLAPDTIRAVACVAECGWTGATRFAMRQPI